MINQWKLAFFILLAAFIVSLVMAVRIDLAARKHLRQERRTVILPCPDSK